MKPELKHLLLGILIGVSLTLLVGATTSDSTEAELTPVQLVADDIEQYVYGVGISKDGRLAVAWSDFRFAVWDTSNGEKILNHELERGEINSVAFSENHRSAIVGTSSGDVLVWGLLEGQVNAVEEFERH